MVMNCTSKQKTEPGPSQLGPGIIRSLIPIDAIEYSRVIAPHAEYFTHWSGSGGGREVRGREQCCERTPREEDGRSKNRPR